jgi:hypothetical protein
LQVVRRGALQSKIGEGGERFVVAFGSSDLLDGRLRRTLAHLDDGVGESFRTGRILVDARRRASHARPCKIAPRAVGVDDDRASRVETFQTGEDRSAVPPASAPIGHHDVVACEGTNEIELLGRTTDVDHDAWNPAPERRGDDLGLVEVAGDQQNAHFKPFTQSIKSRRQNVRSLARVR